jgi:hypothetical protein
MFAIARDCAPLTDKQHQLVATFASTPCSESRALMYQAPIADRTTSSSSAGHGYVRMMRHGAGPWRRDRRQARDGHQRRRRTADSPPLEDFPVRQNIAVLTNGGYHFDLVR